MPFTVRDLGFSMAAREADDRSWMVVIGCGAKSSIDHGNTQTTHTRNEPIDFMQGLHSLDDIGALRTELERLRERLAVMEEDIRRASGEAPA